MAANTHFGQRARAVAMVVLLLTSSLAVLPSASADEHTEIPDNELVEIREDVDLWQRSFLLLRADTTDAATKIPNAEWTIREKSVSETDVNKDTVGVFNKNNEISLTFDPATANADTSLFTNERVTVIAARLDEPNDSLGLDSSVDPIELFSEGDPNDHATFYEISDEYEYLDENGAATVTWKPEQSGNYIVFISTGAPDDNICTCKEGFDVESNTLSINSQAAIIGMDHVVVQDGPSAVTSTTLDDSTATPGDDLSFDVDGTSFTDDSVKHTVFVYDERTGFVDQRFTFEIDGDVASQQDVAENVTFKHSVEELNGVANFHGEFTVGDRMFSNERVEGPFDIETLLSLTPVPIDLTGVETEYIEAAGGPTLDASVTAVDGAPSETIVVETRDDWFQDTQYRWVHVAVSEDGSEIRTNTAEFDLQSEQKPPKDDGDDSTPPSSSPPSLSPTKGMAVELVDVTEDGETFTFTVERAEAGNIARLDLPKSTVSDETGVAFERIDVELTQDNPRFGLDFTSSSSRPADVPALSEDTIPGYLEVERDNVENEDIGNASFQFTLSEAALAQTDTTPENVVLHRYSDGTWETVNTEYVGFDDGTHRFTANSPGFSVFTVGTTPASFEVTSLELDTRSIDNARSATVIAAVTNNGGTADEFTVTLEADGEPVAERNVVVNPGATQEVELVHEFKATGTYELTVNGAPLGSVTVDDESVQPVTTTEDSDDTGLGGWVVFVLLLLAAAAGAVYYQFYYRNDEWVDPLGKSR